MKVELYQITSKKTGKQMDCLKVTIGVYETLVFPSAAELEYIKTQLRSRAHDEFQEEE